MTTNELSEAPYRPWLGHYPPGISWEAPIDLTPVFDRVLAACKRYPQNIAFDFLGASTRYSELEDKINQLSVALQAELGVKKGTRVAMLLPNTPYYVYFYYAILRAGGIVVNCNPLYTVPELSHIINDSEAEILVTLDLKQVFDKAEKLGEQTGLQRIIVCPFAKVLPPLKSLLFNIAKRSDVANIKSSAVADKIVPYERLLKTKRQFSPVAITPEKDAAVQQYTGGTTGTPKGALLSHANISANLSQIDYWGGTVYSPDKKLIAVLPFFHIFSMTACLNVSLVNGMEMLMLPRFELKMLLELIARKRPEILKAVPTLTHALCSSELSKKYDLSCLEVCVSGGAALPDEVRKEFEQTTGGRVLEGYGLTECSPVVCCAPFNAPAKLGSIGQPFPGTDVRFADIEDPAREVAPGERGELQVKGPQVMLGYWRNDDANRDTFVDGWLRTGDVGYVDEEGHMFIVDRMKDLIICSGFNVYPRTIEEAIYRHPDVDECNVIGVPDSYRGEAPVAFVKLYDGKSLTAEQLKGFLKEHLSKIEMPKDIVFKKELPKTLVGKLSKKELRDEYAKLKGKDRSHEQA